MLGSESKLSDNSSGNQVMFEMIDLLLQQNSGGVWCLDSKQTWYKSKLGIDAAFVEGFSVNDAAQLKLSAWIHSQASLHLLKEQRKSPTLYNST